MCLTWDCSGRLSTSGPVVPLGCRLVRDRTRRPGDTCGCCDMQQHRPRRSHRLGAVVLSEPAGWTTPASTDFTAQRCARTTKPITGCPGRRGPPPTKARSATAAIATAYEPRGRAFAGCRSPHRRTPPPAAVHRCRSATVRTYLDHVPPAIAHRCGQLCTDVFRWTPRSPSCSMPAVMRSSLW